MRKILFVLSILITINFFLLSRALAISWDFDLDTTGQPPSGWMYDSHGPNSSVEIDETVYNGSSGKSIHFFDNSTTETAVISYMLENYTSIVLEYYMFTTNNNYYGAGIDLIGDIGNSYHVQFSGGGSGGSGGYIGIAGDYGYVVSELLPYTVDTWYFIRRELNLFDNGTSSGRFYVEEVGNPSNSNSYNIGSLHPNTYINKIVIGTPLTTKSDTYIDNITIEPVPEPATMFLLGAGIVGLAGFRRRFNKN